MNLTEYEIRKKYRYSNISYVFDVYMECEYRANLTQKEYDGLQPGEFRFDYEGWAKRLGYTKKQMERAIKELTTKNIVIIQVVKGNKGTCSKYFLTRFKENNEETNKDNKRRTINESITSLEGNQGEEKEIKKEKKKAHSSQYNNLNIISNNIYSDFEKEILRLYPGKKVKSVRDRKVPKLLKDYSIDELTRCIERYSNECKGKNKQYILNESTFWNGRYIDYLDSNYTNDEEVKPIKNNITNWD